MGIRFVRLDSAKKLSKFRVHTWMNTETFEPMYGIEANVDYGVWAHVVDGNTPMMFCSKATAKAEIKQLSSAAMLAARKEQHANT